jgi:hypothetical protein
MAMGAMSVMGMGFAGGAHGGGEEQENECARRAEQQEHGGGRHPGKFGETLHHIDQPVEAARGLDESRPPAEEERLPPSRRPVDCEEHGHGGKPGQRGQIEGCHCQKPQAAA